MVLGSGWAARPFLKGYRRFVELIGEEQERLAGLLFSRRLIDLAFRVGREPETAKAAAKRVPALRRESEAQARELRRDVPGRRPGPGESAT
jgi:hypothetical protein